MPARVTIERILSEFAFVGAKNRGEIFPVFGLQDSWIIRGLPLIKLARLLGGLSAEAEAEGS